MKIIFVESDAVALLSTFVF